MSFGERIKTFTNWPLDFLTPETMAEAGFKYTGIKDHVICDLCGLMVGSFKPNDNPFSDHKRFSENCFFVKNKNHIAGVSSCGCIMLPQDSFARTKRRVNSDACFPMYKSMEARIASFKDWCFEIDPIDLAFSGFFNSGSGDRVICFQCGGGLSNWGPSDDPIIVHKHFFPKCEFILAQERKIPEKLKQEVSSY